MTLQRADVAYNLYSSVLQGDVSYGFIVPLNSRILECLFWRRRWRWSRNNKAEDMGENICTISVNRIPSAFFNTRPLTFHMIHSCCQICMECSKWKWAGSLLSSFKVNTWRIIGAEAGSYMQCTFYYDVQKLIATD